MKYHTLFFRKLRKKLQFLSPAAVVIGALRVNSPAFLQSSLIYLYYTSSVDDLQTVLSHIHTASPRSTACGSRFCLWWWVSPVGSYSATWVQYFPRSRLACPPLPHPRSSHPHYLNFVVSLLVGCNHQVYYQHYLIGKKCHKLINPFRINEMFYKVSYS